MEETKTNQIDTIDRKALGEVVTQRRRVMKLTQRQLARIVSGGSVHVSRSTIGRIENGQSEKIRHFETIVSRLATLMPEVARMVDGSIPPAESLFDMKQEVQNPSRPIRVPPEMTCHRMTMEEYRRMKDTLKGPAIVSIQPGLVWWKKPIAFLCHHIFQMANAYRG
jgi:transcriptional regulator with XRE-family HTH domain